MRTLVLFGLWAWVCSNCQTNSVFNNLVISTNQRENDDNATVDIFKGCQLSKFWKKKKRKIPFGHVFIDEEIDRKLLRFYLEEKPKTESKNLQISLESDIIEGKGFANFTSNNFIIQQGEIFDNFLSFKCLSNSIENPYLKIILNFTMKHDKEEFFFVSEVTKLCNHSLKDSLDISNLVVIFITIFILFASVNSNFNSKFEDTILGKYPEIRNPENLCIISIIIAIILWFFYIIDILSIWIYITSLVVVPMTIGMIFEALLKKTQIKLTLSYRTLELDFIGSVSMFFLLCIFFGIVLFILWNVTLNWIVSDLIAISITIETIRIFKFTSFKFILFLSFVIFIYDIYWIIAKATVLNEHARLTNQYDHSFPILIICPEFDYRIFSMYVSLPISEIIIPGIVINYFFRVDRKIKYKSHFYFLIGLVTFVIGLVIKFLIFCYANVSIPSFVIIFPLMISCVMFFAYRRGEIEEMIEGFKSTVFAEEEIENAKLTKFANMAYGEESNKNIIEKLEMNLIG